ncbi:hypothetical protein [Aureimonas psammosilenae]|uniref:hypothetical protein n=1 Tax=Aureimonas psammosilenae TaxID=2495496 RepID=UPI0012604F6B|nr:hypothetical protein [Aureimonas psammosilenae]
MTDYREATRERLQVVGTRMFAASALDLSGEHPLKAMSYVPLLPNWCVCVTEPCRCHTPDGPVVWVPSDAIKRRSDAGRNNARGEPLENFYIDGDATVVQETLIRTTADYLPMLRRVGGTGKREESGEAAARAGGFTYAGQHCHDDGILYDSWLETQASGDQKHHCVPVGTCA